MSEEQSGGVTVLYGSAGTAVNFSAANYFHVDPLGNLAVYVDRDNAVAIFPSGGWHRAYNLSLDQPKKVTDPSRQ
jgi:hypothetical protein